MITNLLNEEIAKKFKLNANFDDEEFKRLARKEDLRFNGDMSKTVRRIRDAVHIHNDDTFKNNYIGIKVILDDPVNIKSNLLERLKIAKEQNDEEKIKKAEEKIILKDYFTKVAKLEGKAIRELFEEKTKLKLENESEPIAQEEPKQEELIQEETRTQEEQKTEVKEMIIGQNVAEQIHNKIKAFSEEISKKNRKAEPKQKLENITTLKEKVEVSIRILQENANKTTEFKKANRYLNDKSKELDKQIRILREKIQNIIEEPKKEELKEQPVEETKQEIPATKIELIQKCKQKIEDCFKEINELPQENLIIDHEDWRIKKEIDLEKKALEQIPNIIESFDQACKSDCLEEQNKKYEQLIQIFEENFETINIHHSKKLRIFKRAFVKMLIILDVSETNKICLKQHIFSNLPKMQNNASLTNTKEMIKENIQNPKILLLPMPKTLILRGLPQKPKELTQQYNNMQNIQNNACLTKIQEVIQEKVTTPEIEENKGFKTSLQVINNITRIQENPKQPDKIKHTFKLLRTLRKENKKVAKTMKKTLRYILREATKKRTIKGV